MDINTGKLASTSSNFLKKINDNDINVSKTEFEKIKTNKKLLNDFSDIKSNDNLFKSKIININKQLSEYENNLSKTQYVEQKLNEIDDLIVKKDEKNIAKIIENSMYNNQRIFKGNLEFSSLPELKNQISSIKQEIQSEYINLDKEFKSIQITSQNIISLYSPQTLISEENIKNINVNDLFNSTRLNNKNVIQLIS